MSEDSKAWQQRTELLLGKDKTDRLRQAHVLVVGLGGVGAYAAEMICRAGVGRMTIVDADTVQPSNINRQLPATHSSLGRQKAEVLFGDGQVQRAEIRSGFQCQRFQHRVRFPCQRRFFGIEEDV